MNLRLAIDFLLFIPGIRGAGGSYTMAHDSTVGVGTAFYCFGGAFLIFIVLGTLKAFWDDKEWRGRFIKNDKKKKKSLSADK